MGAFRSPRPRKVLPASLSLFCCLCNELDSISDHMYRMAALAMVLPLPANVDRARAVQMAIAHDMAESLVGDITPVRGNLRNALHELTICSTTVFQRRRRLSASVLQ